MPKLNVKAGDIVALTWSDIVSYGRIETGRDSELPLAIFVSYGRVSHVDKEKVVLLHECEMVTDRTPMREPTAYPVGCIVKIQKLKPQ